MKVRIEMLPTKDLYKGVILLRHLWKDVKGLECRSLWQFKCESVLNPSVKVYETLYGSFMDTPSCFQPQHLYFTNDEEVKVGDYFLVELFNVEGVSGGLHLEKCKTLVDNFVNKEDVETGRHKDNCRKVVATTDKSLMIKVVDYERSGKYNRISEEFSGKTYYKKSCLPHPSKAFLKKYCEVGGIEEVDIVEIR